MRQVARAAGVSLSTVQLWVGRAQHQRLDEVVAAALAAQRALTAEQWGQAGPILVRMAVHTGTVDVRMGEHKSGEYVSGLTLRRFDRRPDRGRRSGSAWFRPGMAPSTYCALAAGAVAIFLAAVYGSRLHLAV